MNDRIRNERNFVAMLFFGVAFIFICAFAGAVHCQTPTPSPTPETVVVTKEFVQDATKAFDLVVEQRAAIQKFLEERAKTDVERASAQTLIASFDRLIAVKDQISTEQQKVILLYEQVIKLQSELIDRLQKQLLKPRSALEKFLKGVKEALLVVAGVALGRGL